MASDFVLSPYIPSEIGTTVIHRNNGEVMHEIALSCDNPAYTNLIFPLNLFIKSLDNIFIKPAKQINSIFSFFSPLS